MKRIASLLLVLILLLGTLGRADTMTVGASGQNVEKLQRFLQYLGYPLDRVTGRYDEKTRQYVRQFQKQNGLDATGEADDETQSLVEESYRGMVRRLQDRLSELGYYSGEQDGRLGSATASALSAFQKNNGLKSTGDIDDETRYALEHGVDLVNAQGVSEGSVSPADDELVLEFNLNGDINEAEQWPEMPAAQEEPTTVADDADLKAASKEADKLSREENRGFQQILIDAGYLAGGADGLIGPKSEQAIKDYQTKVGLPVTGKLDVNTQNALNNTRQIIERKKQVQQRLIDLGYLKGSADGLFGDSSTRALKWFQTFNGLASTGEMNQETYDKLFSDSVATVPAALTRGQRSDEVRRLQQRLIELCYMTGSADGIYGQKTENAVREFQQRLSDRGEDLDVDGVADFLTQQFLYLDGCSTYLQDVREGDTGADATRVELRLSALGYMDEDPDDTLDAYAVKALKLFQQSAGLAETGVVDEATMEKLFRKSAPVAAAYAPHVIQLGDSNRAVADVQQALILSGLYTDVLTDGKYGTALDNSIAAAASYLESRGDARASLLNQPGVLSEEGQALIKSGEFSAYHQDVASGDKGPEVSRVQTRLYSLFYLTRGGVDGNAGSSTAKAIQAFQEKNGLDNTGVADRATQELLFSEDAKGDWTKHRLEVSIQDQRVYAYELNDAGMYELKHTFICSTGADNSTPRGVYRSTTRPQDRWHYFVEYYCWAQYSYVITGNILFHSVLFYSNSDDAINNVSVGRLGSPASHGCVRLQVEDAKWIFENCEKGTTVIIY